MKPPYCSPTQLIEPPDAFQLNQGLAELTPREWEILLSIAEDLTNTEIADQLALTPKSVENYRTRIGTKLSLKGHHKLAKFARKHAVELRQRYEDLLIKSTPPP